MAAKRTMPGWVLGAVSAAAFVVGTSAQGPTVGSQGVVTPSDPIFAVQDPSPAPSPAPAEPAPAGQDNSSAQAPATPPGGRGGRGGGPRPFNQVITSEARTDDGIFKVHRVGDTVYYEIPKSELGKDFLWVTQIKKTTLGAGYGGQVIDDHVVRWEQHGNRVFLKLVHYDVVADPAKPIAQAVADANNPAILRAFNVAAISPIGNLVIDVTSLFTAELMEFSPRQALGARGMDPSRTYIEKVVSFPQNINVQVTQTYTGITDGGGRGGPGTSGTIVLFHSMVKLPETPMTPRLFDQRIGYFTTGTFDFGREENKVAEREFLLRYRLEKKDPTAAISEPVKPIVYYVDPATPARFVPWIKKAIEDWNPAFEAAGFEHAVVAKEAPSKTEDPDWDPEDVRYSVIRWLPSTIENASGPNIHDPRSGEILEADIQLYHNVLNLASMWYFTQVGPLDPRATSLPLPDDLMGRLVEFVVAHELGHTLGLRHNMKASSLYSLAQVRDKNWVKENGHTPSIMDYARFNYVAQPEDGIAVDDLIPKIGPYDRWAIAWGYKPVPGASMPDDERKTLDQWAREQDTTPYLRFMTGGTSELDAFPFDPGQQRESVGDADPVHATELGLKNLQRVADMLIPATTRPGESYDDLRDTYGRLVAQWRLEVGHVANLIGGVESREVYPGQTGARYTIVPRARQADALQFLLKNVFRAPAFLTSREILARIEPVGTVARVRTAQTSLLNALLQVPRLDRMAEQATVAPGAYAPLQFLSDLRNGLWSELQNPAQPIDIYRRNVQRAYLDTFDNRLNIGPPPVDEIRAMLRGELRALDAQIAAALPRVTDTASRRHLQDARDTIATVLDPRAMRTRTTGLGILFGGARGAGAAPAGATRALSSAGYDFEHDPFLEPSAACFVDYVVN
ncbi:MAG: zinc-dependent metalloprotease [Acidobacteria bacterium]|nr:zinc-dependent metalloprotease [Acidobacteriota bacterium]